MSGRKERRLAMQHPVAVREDWETPPDFFAPLNWEFRFTLDVCATAENAKCARYFTPADDGLAQDWGREVCWMNPPYGKEIPKWMAKAYEASAKGATVVCLVPARTDTRWWHEYAEPADFRRFVKGRIRFVGARYNAPFPCAVVVFLPHAEESAA
jgi:phage N-6-adenine-methyltransferase